jgi:hypothetical protein
MKIFTKLNNWDANQLFPSILVVNRVSSCLLLGASTACLLAATYICDTTPTCTTTIITLKPCALNAEFQRFILRFNKISLLCRYHTHIHTQRWYNHNNSDNLLGVITKSYPRLIICCYVHANNQALLVKRLLLYVLYVFFFCIWLASKLKASLDIILQSDQFTSSQLWERNRQLKENLAWGSTTQIEKVKIWCKRCQI